MYLYFCSGELAEWSNALVLKTSVPQGTESSNLSFSATFKKPLFGAFFMLNIFTFTIYLNTTHLLSFSYSKITKWLVWVGEWSQIFTAKQLSIYKNHTHLDK